MGRVDQSKEQILVLVLTNTFASLVALIHFYVLVLKLLNKKIARAHRNAEGLNPGAPSPSIPPIRINYDVFLSFRGVDTRKSFTDYLYYGFIDAGIRVFRDDDELHAGDKINSDLMEAIENSRILIPIISLNYASSKWCLDELVHVMECNKRLGIIVLPIFYKVESVDVQHQIGGFGEAFHYYGRRFDQKVVEKWKQALKEVTSLQGWESEKVANGHEGKLVKSVVQKVLNELKKAMELVVSDYLVGIDSFADEVMELVNKSSGATLYVGIYGMGGIGKTTLVKIIYNKLFNLFEHCSFIVGIRESCERNGVKHVQIQLISDILKINVQLYDKDEGINFISSKFKDKKVLIVLDDVDMNNQFEALVGNPNWFAPGSRIFVTTRKEGLLDRAQVDIKYEHKEMDEEQSLLLFSRHAFRRDSPTSEFLALSRFVVSITGGLPLALKIVGSFLCGKRPSQWRDTIEKMQNVPHKAVREKLRICYEELEEDQRQMFLDIACFLIGSDARVVSHMWDAYGFCTRVGIEVLKFLSFISIGDNHEFRMQNEIRDLGREIVHEESCELHKRSRLWNKEEALKVLKGNKGTVKIEAICLEDNSTKFDDKDDSDYINGQGSRIFTDEQFRNLPSLRFLHMSDVNLFGDFHKIFSQLRWLKWGNCSPTFVADNFHAGELVILDLSGSSISDDWGGWSSIMLASKLKVLNLTDCHSLKSTFYLSAFKRLEILILRECGELEQIDPCIGDLETLVSLDLSGCLCLKELPPQMGKLEQLKELLLNRTMIQGLPSSVGSLKKLETLIAKDCKFLLGLPDSIGRLLNLSTLVLSGCVELAALPDKIGFLVNLRCLSMGCCHQMREIPKSIGKLKSLIQLDLSGCSGLEELPPQIGELEQLKELLLDQTMIREIPSSIGSLMKLETLSAKDCELLVGLPDSIGHLANLSTLVLSGCVELATLPNSVGFLVNLRYLSLRCCHQLRKIPSSIGKLKLLTQLDLGGCSRLEELPPQMGKLEQLKEPPLHQPMIQEILSSYGPLKKPEMLSAEDCKLLFIPESSGLVLQSMSLDFFHSREISNSFGMLKRLTQLNLTKCSSLAELPPLDCLKQLKILDLESSRFGSLLRCCHRLGKILNSIGMFDFLIHLDIRGCSHLEELPHQMGELKQLKRLLLDQTMIRHLPSSISSPTKLETLSAKDCELLVGLPDSIGRLVNLSTLVLSGCAELATLPDSIGFLMNLRYLSLRCCCRLRMIPSSIGNLKLLTQLDLVGCSRLEELPPQMGKLEQLKELHLHQTMIQEILSFPGPLKKPEMLSAKDCKFLFIPDLSGLVMQSMSLDFFHSREISNSYEMLKRLTQLNSTECSSLVELPPLDCLKQLKILDLEALQVGSPLGCSHRLRKILNSIGMFDFLIHLDIRGCSHLEELPHQMGELKQLKRLLLDQTMIRNLPSSISFLTKLETLSAKDCDLLVGLPDSIGHLVNLSTLVLSGCAELATLPDSIGFLMNLRYLSLRCCCRLRMIPSSIGNLKLLTQLDLSWTMVMELPESIGELQNLEVLGISHSSIK